MVDINEANVAVSATPADNIKQKMSFVYKSFYNKDGEAKSVRIINYKPGTILSAEEITVIRNFKTKLKKGRIIEQDFIIIPTRAGVVYIPLDEISDFCTKITDLVHMIGKHNEG